MTLSESHGRSVIFRFPILRYLCGGLMNRHIEILKRLLGVFMLTLFVGYLSSVTLFYHSHNIDGRVITHSHPYHSAPDTGGHTHSQNGMNTMAQLSLIVMLLAVTGVVPRPFFVELFSVVLPIGDKVSNLLPVLPSLRAPPVSF